MLPHFAPPLSHDYRSAPAEAQSLPFTPLFLLWLGLVFAGINSIDPAAFDILPLGTEGRYLVILGLAMPAFLSKRRFAQPFAALLVGFAVFGLYLDHLRSGSPAS